MTNEQFKEWESEVFGYGYGTGEEYTLATLKKFFTFFPESYDYEKAENLLGKETFWLLLNILCRADVIEYGTSPRYGWYTEKGKEVLAFVKEKIVQEMYDIVMN